MAIRAGVRSIEHGYLISRESIMRMADGGVYWVPTLLPVFLLGESKGFREDHPACAMENLRRIYGRHEENLALAHEVGVRIVAGTDAGASGIEPGPSVYAELNLMRRAGLPVEAVLDAATRYPGEMMESANGILMGSIDPGREARFVVLPPEVPGGFWEPEDVLGVVTVV
jgi:imidazolonepropionase-like amidohydrolase